MSDNIFIVDDNIHSLELMAEILLSAEYTNIKSFGNPSDVLAAVYDGQRPYLVITDFQMAIIDGVTLLCTLSAILRDLSGIIVSSDIYAVNKRSGDFPVIDKNDIDFCDLLLGAVKSAQYQPEYRIR